MDSEKMGPLIRRLRNGRRMTQKELAAKLNVTDKAVSKWERSASLPDVSLLLPLAEALGVSVTELLGGLQAEKAAPPDPAGDILAYACQAAPQRRDRVRLWLLVGISAAFLLAALVCWICDTAPNGGLTWSPVVDVSLALAWVTLLPLLTARRRPLALTLGVLTAAILPYLYLLGRLLGDGRIFRFGLPIAPAAALYLWALWAACRKLRRRRWLAAGTALLLTGLLSLWVNAAVCALSRLSGGAGYGDSVFTLALAAVCFAADFAGRRPVGP